MSKTAIMDRHPHAHITGEYGPKFDETTRQTDYQGECARALEEVFVSRMRDCWVKRTNHLLASITVVFGKDNECRLAEFLDECRNVDGCTVRKVELNVPFLSEFHVDGLSPWAKWADLSMFIVNSKAIFVHVVHPSSAMYAQPKKFESKVERAKSVHALVGSVLMETMRQR